MRRLKDLQNANLAGSQFWRTPRFLGVIEKENKSNYKSHPERDQRSFSVVDGLKYLPNVDLIGSFTWQTLRFALSDSIKKLNPQN